MSTVKGGLTPPRERRRRNTSQPRYGNNIFREAIPSPHPRQMMRLLNRETFDVDERQSACSSTTASQTSQPAVSEAHCNQSTAASDIPALTTAGPGYHRCLNDNVVSSTIGKEDPNNAPETIVSSTVERRSSRSGKRPAPGETRSDDSESRGCSHVAKRRKPFSIFGSIDDPAAQSQADTESFANTAVGDAKPSMFGLPSPFGFFNKQLFRSFIPALNLRSKSFMSHRNDSSFCAPAKCARRPTEGGTLAETNELQDTRARSNSLVLKFPNFLDSLVPPHRSAHENMLNLPPTYTGLPDLVSEELGGRILYCTDEFFGSATRMLCGSPVTKDPLTSERHVDGWETRRKRSPGHNWCLIQLGIPGRIHGVELNTRYMNGNHAPYVSIEAANIPDLEEMLLSARRKSGLPEYVPGVVGGEENSCMENLVGQLLKSQTVEDLSQWRDIVPMHPLSSSDTAQGSRHFVVPIDEGAPRVVTHVRLNLFPDGGVSRLRLFGVGSKQLEAGQHLNFASVSYGAVVVGCSDEHYGSSKNLLLDSIPNTMLGGWLTARNPGRHPCLEADPETGEVKNLIGEHWVIIKLAARVDVITAVEIDTAHFIGNYPEKVVIQVADVSSLVDIEDIQAQQQLLVAAGTNDALWNTLLPETRLGPNANHYFKVAATEQSQNLSRGGCSSGSVQQASDQGAVDAVESSNGTIIGQSPVTHVKMTIFPDGGIARLRVWGRQNS